MRPRVTPCRATYPSHPQRPCTDWINETRTQFRNVAVGGTVIKRLATGSTAVANAVSPRASESMAGVHRCRILIDHDDAHSCGCGFEWGGSAHEDGTAADKPTT